VTVHTIDIRPSWDAVVRITLGVLGTNDFYSDASRDAKKHLFDMANILDTLNSEKLLTQEMAEKIEENRNFEKDN
jgi:hypothetical protein|tara:strand:+ start:1249 stop:1473 length:225 start_codon:yes stop_codon:yes gene_type:complete